MSERVKDKVAIVMGAGSVGPGWGNGKAAAVLYAREGARVLAVDLVQSAGEETQRIIQSEGAGAEHYRPMCPVPIQSTPSSTNACATLAGSTSCTTTLGSPRPAAPKTLPKTTGIDSLRSTSGACT